MRPCEDELDDTLSYNPPRQNMPNTFLLTDDNTLNVLAIHDDHNEMELHTHQNRSPTYWQKMIIQPLVYVIGNTSGTKSQ